MPRFSPKCKEIFDLIWYHGNIHQARNLLKEIKDPLDHAFSRVWIATFLMNFQMFTDLQLVLAELENDNNELQDNFLHLIINTLYFAYYMGFNNPVVSKTQSEKHFKIVEEAIQLTTFQDDWENYFVIGFFELIQAWNAGIFQNDLVKAIDFHRKSLVAFSKVPQDGEYLSQFLQVNLSEALLLNGQFDEAGEAAQESLSATRKFESIYQIWPLEGLSWIWYFKGDLLQAMDLAEKDLEVARQHNNTFGILGALSLKGFLAFQEGNYDFALECYQESVTYRKQYDVPLRTFFGYFKIFSLHLSRFQVSKDPHFLEEAEKVLPDLKEISIANPDDPTMANYTKYAQALLFKHGTIRTKGHALDILEELVDLYPKDIEISLNLMELLFEDVSLSGNQNTMLQLEKLMQKVSQIPLRMNPKAIFSFVSQQIVQAKYHYYLKGDVTRALDLLLSANNRLETYNLPHLTKRLNQEIAELEKERNKWESADFSLKERMKTSEFKQYLQEALVMAGKNRST